MNKFKSRKFIVTLVGLAAMLLAPITGIELSDAQIASIAGVIMTYLGGQSYVDGKEK